MSERPGAGRGPSPAAGSREVGKLGKVDEVDEERGSAADRVFPGAVVRTQAVPDVAGTDVRAEPPAPPLRDEESASTAGTVLALLVTAALGVGVAVVAPTYGMSVDGERVGPGFLPLVAGGGLAVLSLLVLAKELRAAAARRRERGGAAEAPTDLHGADTADVLGRTAARRQRNMRMVTAALVVAVLLIPLIGFLEAFALFLLFASIVVERRPVLPSVLITLTAVAVVYAIFVVFLNVRLPMGALAYFDLGG